MTFIKDDHNQIIGKTNNIKVFFGTSKPKTKNRVIPPPMLCVAAEKMSMS
jgi:hypothetical protein